MAFVEYENDGPIRLGPAPRGAGISRKVTAATGAAGLGGFAASDVHQLAEWGVSLLGMPEDAAAALARIGTAAVLAVATFAAGWLTRER